jgi:hypothetical protein
MKSAATLKAEQRAKMRAAGYVLKQIWVRPSWWPRILKFVERLK